MVAKIRLVIEFDGTDFSGWQIQPNGRSVQEVMEKALEGLLGARVRLHSSGRTDAGVHARGMVAHFVSERSLPLSAYREGLNRLLPADVAVREADAVPDDFHARFSATGKWYRYTIWRGAVRSPLSRRFAWHLYGPLDLPTMELAARYLVGRHDFSAFRTTGCAAGTTEREIYRVDFSEGPEVLEIDVHGSGFLKNMVRIMVGTLVEVGQGKRSPASLPLLLTGRVQPGMSAGATAPAQGLCLMEVFYPSQAG